MVAGAVACAWIGQWIQATEQNDTAGVTEATEALATARESVADDREEILFRLSRSAGLPDL